MIGKAFIKEVTLDPETRDTLGNAHKDMQRYEVAKLSGDAFRAALQKIAG